MKSLNIIANSQIKIDAPIDKVWEALVNPETIKKVYVRNKCYFGLERRK